MLKNIHSLVAIRQRNVIIAVNGDMSKQTATSGELTPMSYLYCKQYELRKSIQNKNDDACSFCAKHGHII